VPIPHNNGHPRPVELKGSDIPMVTDPTRTITIESFDTELETHAETALKRLAALPVSTDIPIVTASLDWQVEVQHPGNTPGAEELETKRSSLRNAEPAEDRSTRRPARVLILQELQKIVDHHGPRGPVFDSLSADLNRITDYLDNEIDPAAQGVIIVSCSAKGIFDAVTTAIPLDTRLHIGPTVALSELARIADDFPTYAVLLADQRTAFLSLIQHAVPTVTATLEATGYPRRQEQGGWSQRRYQTRADVRIDSFAHEIAEDTRKMLDEFDIDTLIVAGDEIITSALESNVHKTVKDRWLKTVHLGIRSNMEDVLNVTTPIVEQMVRDEEVAAVERLSDAIGEGGFGATGPEEVLNALQVGQVDTLVMADDFAGSGWADYSMPLFGVGDPPSKHPLNGDVEAIVPIDLREEFIRLAIETDADIQIVATTPPIEATSELVVPQAQGHPLRSTAAQMLDTYDGVGAILRYRMDEQPQPETI
jgi:peptide subunit release factor 1 (eRF1)